MNNLKAARKAKNMTQVEVAKRIGLAQISYSSWEKGTTKIDHTSLIKLSELFEVSVDYLLGKETENKKEPASENRDGLTEMEIEILDRMSKLTPEDRGRVHAYIQGLLAAREE